MNLRRESEKSFCEVCEVSCIDKYNLEFRSDFLSFKSQSLHPMLFIQFDDTICYVFASAMTMPSSEFVQLSHKTFVIFNFLMKSTCHAVSFGIFL